MTGIVDRPLQYTCTWPQICQSQSMHATQARACMRPLAIGAHEQPSQDHVHHSPQVRSKADRAKVCNQQVMPVPAGSTAGALSPRCCSLYRGVPTLISSPSSFQDRPWASAERTAFRAPSTASALYSIRAACRQGAVGSCSWDQLHEQPDHAVASCHAHPGVDVLPDLICSLQQRLDY